MPVLMEFLEKRLGASATNPMKHIMIMIFVVQSQLKTFQKQDGLSKGRVDNKILHITTMLLNDYFHNLVVEEVGMEMTIH